MTTFGFSAINNFNSSLINQDYINAVLVNQRYYTYPAASHFNPYYAGGVAYGIQLPYNISTEVPLLFIRPALPEKWFGCATFYKDGVYNEFLVNTLDGSGGGGIRPFSYVSFNSECAFDLAYFYTSVGTPITDTSTFGLQVFNTQSKPVYDSRLTYPLLTHLLYKPPGVTSTGGGLPITFSISGHSTMPWILLNDLPAGYYGEEGAIYAKVNASYSQVSYANRIIYSLNGLTEPLPTSMSHPYSQIPRYFSIAKF